jgi:hypothetical protein
VAFRRRSIPRLLSLDLQDLILIQMPTPSRRCLRYRSSVPASSGRLSSSDVWWRTCQSTGPPYTSTGRTSARRSPTRCRSRRGGKRRSRPSIQGRRVKDQRSDHHVCRRRGISTPQSERCKYSGPQHLEHQVPGAHVSFEYRGGCRGIGTGRVSIDGDADFLTTPHAGLKAQVMLLGIALRYFAPIAERYGVTIIGLGGTEVAQ